VSFTPTGRVERAVVVGGRGDTAGVSDEDRATPGAASVNGADSAASAAGGADIGHESSAGGEAAQVVTVVDRFLGAGISRAAFEAHLAAGRIAVAGVRITDAATPAPQPLDVRIMLDPS
jgi:hypothetical protein